MIGIDLGADPSAALTKLDAWLADAIAQAAE